MITYNTYFNNFNDLTEFLNLHTDICQSKNLLIQIFSGVIEEDRLQVLSNFLLNKLPQANIIGSTTDGEIIDDIVSTQKIVISFSLFEKSTIKISSIENTNSDESFKCGQNIAQDLISNNSKVFILFASGLGINGESFLDGIHDISKDVIIAGGLSADNAHFKNSFLICNNKIQTTGAVGISINSDVLKVKNKFSLAWENLGRKFLVNKSIDNRVYEIDGITPYDLYKKYLGVEVSKKLPGIGIEFPLVIQRNNEKIARAVIKVHDDGSMTFAGNIKQDSIVRFGIGNIEDLLNGSYELYKELSTFNNESIFIYSCMARRRFLEDKSNLDIENFKKLSNVAGFFTYGEFFSTKKTNEFLNESLTLISLCENCKTKKDIKFDEKYVLSDSLLKQKALSNIINKTSEEFDILNAQLEKKVEDTTEENVKYEKYIIQQDKLAQMGEMIANIAHQWRQPLSAISSNASAIIIQDKMGVLNSDELLSTMERIMKNSQFLSDTINTFRDFIKEESEEKCVIVQDRLNLVIDIMSTTLNDCSIKLYNNINYSVPIKKSLVIGELSQVVLNIMNNAKDVLLEKKIQNPWVKIDCISNNNNILISIEDNAGGIDDDIISKVFDPYFSTKKESHGTGIGLYMSQNIIKNHFNGRLYVNNTVYGAKFFIQIPLDN